MIKLRWMGGTAFLLLAASCAVPLAEYEKNHYLLSPAGERIEIKDKAGGTAAGEFLFADEDSVYVLIDGQKDLPPRVAAMPYKTIRTLKIRGVKNDKWLSAVLLFQGLPALLLGATYMVDTDNPGGGDPSDRPHGGSSGRDGLVSWDGASRDLPWKGRRR